MILLWVLEQLAPLFVLLGLGFIAGQRLAVRDETLRDLAGLLIYLLVPALVLNSTLRSDFVVRWEPVVAAATVVTASSAVAWALVGRLALRRQNRGSFLLSAGFMNAGSLGTSVALLTYGADAFLLAVLYYITVQALLYTVGPLEVGSGRESVRSGLARVLRIPLIWALLAGLVISGSGAALPGVLATPLEMLARAAIPVLLLTLGLQLSRLPRRFGRRFARVLPALAVARMAVGFLTALLLIAVLRLSGELAAVVLISSSMPSAITTYVVGARFGGNRRLLSMGIVWTTLLALVTIPVVVTVTQALP